MPEQDAGADDKVAGAAPAPSAEPAPVGFQALDEKAAEIADAHITHTDAPAVAPAAAIAATGDPRVPPSHEAIVEALQGSVAVHGPGFLVSLKAALAEIEGFPRHEAERLRWYLTQPKNAADAFERCRHVIDTMQGSDAARRETMTLLKQHYT